MSELNQITAANSPANSTQFQAMSLLALDSHIKTLVRSERQVTDQILKAIAELDQRRGYAELGFSSLFSYLTTGVGYSESSAQRRIASARLLAKVSHNTGAVLRDKLKSGAINLSQLAKVNSLLGNIEQAQNKQDKQSDQNMQKEEFAANTLSVASTLSLVNSPSVANSSSTKDAIFYTTATEQKTAAAETYKSAERPSPKSANEIVQQLLPKLEHKDLNQTESLIADTLLELSPNDKATNSKDAKAKVRCGAEGKVTITFTLSKEQNAKLQKVLAKKSHAIPNGDILVLFEHLLDRELKSYQDGSGKNTKTEKDYQLENKTGKATKQAKPNRKYISVNVKRKVFAKAEHRCEYISPLTQARCAETKFLTIDHRIPLALGGTDHETNLRVCCFTHNLAEAKRLGINKQR